MTIRSEQSLFHGAIESAHVFNGVAAECAVTGGLTVALHDYSTESDLVERMGFHVSKLPALRALLNVLVARGLIEQRKVDGIGPVYRTRHSIVEGQRSLDGGLCRYEPRYTLLDPWFGEAHVQLIHASNREILGSDLSFFRSPSTKIRFDRTFLDAWRTNLTNPLYEFGRVLAVQEMVRHGTRFLDLASGLGYGAQRIAEICQRECKIDCVDKSVDMLAETARLIYPRAKVVFICWDLNRGLPPAVQARTYDGVLFNGAFHFICDKGAQLREIARVLRPGGVLVVGHCYSRSNFADESMHDLYFSMLADEAWPIRFDDLRTLVTDAGFAEIRTYHRGSHSYIISERLSESDDNSALESP